MEWNRWPLPTGKSQPFSLDPDQLGTVIIIILGVFTKAKLLSECLFLIRRRSLNNKRPKNFIRMETIYSVLFALLA